MFTYLTVKCWVTQDVSSKCTICLLTSSTFCSYLMLSCIRASECTLLYICIINPYCDVITFDCRSDFLSDWEIITQDSLIIWLLCPKRGVSEVGGAPAASQLPELVADALSPTPLSLGGRGLANWPRREETFTSRLWMTWLMYAIE